MAAAAIVFSLAGAICELAGLGLVVIEIRRDRDQARKLLASLKPPARLERQFPAHRSARRPLASYGDVRSNVVRQELREVAASTANAIIDVQKLIFGEMDRVEAQLREERVEGDAQLRAGLSYILAESLVRRTVGAALLALGIVLAATGSVLGSLS